MSNAKATAIGPSEPRALFRVEGITKHFGGTIALNNVSFDLQQGEVHCLVGENGAGKSTLIKIMSGSVIADSGDLEIDGSKIQLRSPIDGHRLGIGVVYQELELVPDLTVMENVFLGREPQSLLGRVLWSHMRKSTAAVLESIGADISPDAVVASLSVAHSQMVALAKVLSMQPRVLVLDEPSAVLGGPSLQALLASVKRLRDQGVGIIYISHRLEEVFGVGDRVTVLRDGAVVWTKHTRSVSQRQLIQAMVGRDPSDQFPAVQPCTGKRVLLAVQGLTTRRLRSVSLELRAGEILGITGLVGSGANDLARALTGLEPILSGDVHLHGGKVTRPSPRGMAMRGMVLVPEDRKNHGLVLPRSILDNATYSILAECGFVGVVRPRKLYERAVQYRDHMRIKAPSIYTAVRNLSGGNQQKVVLARALAGRPKIFILEEPTRGIDVGAKAEIYELIVGLINDGHAVILISSEMAEVTALSHQLLVLAEGRRTAAFSRPYDHEAILSSALPRADRGAEDR